MPWLAPVIVLAGAGALLWLGHRVRHVGAGRANPYAARAWRYQPAALAVAIIVLLLVRVAAPEHADYLRVGDWSAPVSAMGWLGIADGESWASIGLTFLVVMTVVTAVVMWLQAGRGAGLTPAVVVRAIPLAIVFAAVNALTEEVLFRVTLAESLAPVASVSTVAFVSAAVFGLPHWFGDPGRMPGVVLAGFMGWFLSLSVLQTGGIGWAWTIHAVQDIVIITLLMARETLTVPPPALAARS